jgi:hypothetical protein
LRDAVPLGNPIFKGLLVRYVGQTLGKIGTYKGGKSEKVKV